MKAVNSNSYTCSGSAGHPGTGGAWTSCLNNHFRCHYLNAQETVIIIALCNHIVLKTPLKSPEILPLLYLSHLCAMAYLMVQLSLFYHLS